MDFKRIERILIIAFLLLNIYLVYILWDQRQDVVNTSRGHVSGIRKGEVGIIGVVFG